MEVANTGTTEPLVAMVAVEWVGDAQVTETQTAGEGSFGNANVQDPIRASNDVKLVAGLTG